MRVNIIIWLYIWLLDLVSLVFSLDDILKYL